MAYEVSIDHETRTIMVVGSGEGRTEDTLELIARLGDVLATLDGYNFLYDSAGMTISSTPADMMKVADALFGGGVAFRRFAIVVPHSRVPLARIFTALADPHGIRANVFTHRSDAEEWLRG